MQTPSIVVSRTQWLWFWMATLLFLLSQSAALAQPSCCGGSGCCGGPQGEACTLTYGARGVVVDSGTGEPIEGATITVIDASGTSAADGAFDVSASRAETCHIDYFYSLSVSAPGYVSKSASLYTSAVFPSGLEIELDPTDETPDPTTTPPTCIPPTPPLCAVGETVQCTTDDGCDNDCVCIGCDACPPGHVYSGDPNSCACVDPNASTPTPTPPCPIPTPPLCPIGQTPACSGSACTLDCTCGECPSCPEGLEYSGEPNRCECIDPNGPTRTPTPTPNGCESHEVPDCPAGEYVSCGPGCVCDCQPCADCPNGLEFSNEPNSCVCVDIRTPSLRPTATATPFGPQTPPVCPTRTPLACGPDETTVCDTSVDPCGVCECRAVPQQPSDDNANLNPGSSGGCGIVPAQQQPSSLWSWPLLLIAVIAWRRPRLRRTDLSR